MKRIRIEWILLIASVAAFFGVGVSIGCMFADGYIPGVIFWICLIAGTILQIVLSLRCRKLRSELENIPKHRIGLLSFGRNIYGLTADLVTVIALVAFIITNVLNGALVTQLVLMGWAVFGFSMHCVCNGNNLDILMRYGCKQRRSRTSREKTRGGINNE